MLTSTLILTLGSLTSAIIPSAHCVPVPFDLLATSELSYLPSHSFSSFSLRLFPTSVNSTSLARHAPDLSTSSYLLQRASSDDATRDLITTIRDRRVAIIAQDAIDPLVGNVSDISDWYETELYVLISTGSLWLWTAIAHIQGFYAWPRWKMA